MDIGRLQQQSETRWIIPRTGRMRTPAILYASPELIHAMDTKVLEQLTNIAALPGIKTAAFAMPDAHWGYGFPIGGVVSAGGVGFDISCGVRTLMFARLRQGYGGQAGKDGRAILAHLPRCERFAVCLYSGAARALHLRQTDAMQN